jgi:hypothetical protein
MVSRRPVHWFCAGFIGLGLVQMSSLGRRVARVERRLDSLNFTHEATTEAEQGLVLEGYTTRLRNKRCARHSPLVTAAAPHRAFCRRLVEKLAALDVFPRDSSSQPTDTACTALPAGADPAQAASEKAVQ